MNNKMPSTKRRDLSPLAIEHIEILKALNPTVAPTDAAAIRYALFVAVMMEEKERASEVKAARRAYRKNLLEV
jgi:hypothetical protein